MKPVIGEALVLQAFIAAAFWLPFPSAERPAGEQALAVWDRAAVLQWAYASALEHPGFALFVVSIALWTSAWLVARFIRAPRTQCVLLLPVTVAMSALLGCCLVALLPALAALLAVLYIVFAVVMGYPH